MSKFDYDASIVDELGVPRDRPPRPEYITCPVCKVIPIWDYESECFDCWVGLDKLSHDSQYPCDLETLV